MLYVIGWARWFPYHPAPEVEEVFRVKDVVGEDVQARFEVGLTADEGER